MSQDALCIMPSEETDQEHLGFQPRGMTALLT